ncbi:MAG: tetraacyldisaccharide 4'-kinase [Gemmatimonadota bacterium]|nr:tetraacyldisaccharide 4'-kinase [Gemmatimonadota bacterium]
MLIVTRWLWAKRSLSARIVRGTLLPPSLLYDGVMRARARAYATGLLPSEIPAVPTVAVGNLTVGGSGKTPIAAWIAEYYAAHGRRPGIVLRGYGGDEGLVHHERLPGAVVIESPDRLAGAKQAEDDGADVIVLDDAFQRLDIGRDLNVAVVSAESVRAVRWTLPAGPWRERLGALRRADLIVVTRKRATRAAAHVVLQQVRRAAPRAHAAVARLGVTGFQGLLSRRSQDAADLAGARVLVCAGIADPDSFASQCRALGACVQQLPVTDHHLFSARDVQRLLHAARQVDYVVVTEKDAVKLRHLWPVTAPEPLVSRLDVTWERGRAEVETALDAAVADVGQLAGSACVRCTDGVQTDNDR